jgi:predicted nucleotidyltransferase
MKFHAIIENFLSSKIRIAVLRILLRYPSKRFSGRELARLLGASPSHVLKTLESFSRHGLIHKARIGKATEWTINKHHFLVGRLSFLLKLDEEAMALLCQKIKAAFSQKKNIVKIIIFGSAAKGEEKPDSDIDLFILVKEKKHKKEVLLIIDKLNESLIPLFGNSISAIIYSLKELKDKRELGLVQHIKEEGKIILAHG